jgi:hypothetical protein
MYYTNLIILLFHEKLPENIVMYVLPIVVRYFYLPLANNLRMRRELHIQHVFTYLLLHLMINFKVEMKSFMQGQGTVKNLGGRGLFSILARE